MTTTTSTADLRKIFVDTSAWLATIDRNDQYHEDALRFRAGLSTAIQYVTTWGILSETYTWLRYHGGYHLAMRWLHETSAAQEQGALVVVFPSPSTEAGTRRALSRFTDQDLSYVDALSLYVCESRTDVDAIFAFDHHLTLAGLPVLPGSLR